MVKISAAKTVPCNIVLTDVQPLDALMVRRSVITTNVTKFVMRPKVADRSTENKMLTVMVPIRRKVSFAGGIDFHVPEANSFRWRMAEMIVRTKTSFTNGIWLSHGTSSLKRPTASTPNWWLLSQHNTSYRQVMCLLWHRRSVAVFRLRQTPTAIRR